MVCAGVGAVVMLLLLLLLLLLCQILVAAQRGERLSVVRQLDSLLQQNAAQPAALQLVSTAIACCMSQVTGHRHSHGRTNCCRGQRTNLIICIVVLQ